MSRFLLGLVALGALACSRGFQVRNYPTPPALFAAGLELYEQREWKNAITAFEQFTLLAPTRDSLLPRAHYYLGRAHEQRGQHLLAASSFQRLFEGFPDDTLSDDALLGMAENYEKHWRGPHYDIEYALRALDSYTLMHRLYPASPLVRRAEEGEARVTEGLAQKDFDNGMHYFRRRAYDSALIYFGDVVKDYPGTKVARLALLQMVETYRRLGYMDDVADVCRQLRAAYRGDAAAQQACMGIPADTTS